MSSVRFPHLVLALGLAGCATPELDEEEPPPPPIDFDAWCGPADPPPWSLVSAGLEGDPTLGACGHMLLDEVGRSVLYFPDGSEELLDEPVSSPSFSPTGHLAAWYTGSLMLELRELASGETRELGGPFDRFGFVRSLSNEIGTRLFTCASTLRLHTFDAGADVDLGSGVCPTISSSARAPLLAYANEANQLYLVNTDTNDTTLINGNFAVAPGMSDQVELDHDGRALLHTRYFTDPELNAWIAREVEVYDTEGQALGLIEGPAQLVQGSLPGTPPFVHGEDDGLFVVSSGRLVKLLDAADMLDYALASQAGDLLVSTTDFRVLRYASDRPTEPVELDALDSAPRSLIVSPLGLWSSWLSNEGCFDEFCDYFLTYNHLWSSERGLVGRFESVGEGRSAMLFDNGTLLVRTLLSVDLTAVPGSTPKPKFRLIDGEGKLADSLPESFTEAELIADWLPNQRALVRFKQVDGEDQLGIVGANPASVADLGIKTEYDVVTVDARGLHVSARRGFDGRVYWGALEPTD